MVDDVVFTILGVEFVVIAMQVRLISEASILMSS
jgi:hypothetical protein